MKLPFNKNAELFRWGPIPGKYFYDADFSKAIFINCPKRYKFSWPKTLFIFNDGMMVWVNDYNELRKVGKEIFVKYMMNQKKREELIGKWRFDLKKIYKFHKKLDNLELDKLSDVQFLTLWDKYYKLFDSFWLPTIKQELGNYGSEKYLEEELRNYVTEDEIILILEKLTAPSARSFYQQEELDLIRTKNIKNHCQKYFWIENSYNGTQVLGEEYFQNRKNKIGNRKIKLAGNDIEKIDKTKREIIQKYKLSKKIVKISEALVAGVEWQDERKKNIFITLHYKYLLLKEFARRYDYKINDLENFASWEIRQLIIDKKSDAQLGKRKKAFVIEGNPGIKVLENEAKHYWGLYAIEKVPADVSDIIGTVASQGKGSISHGRVRIVLDPKKIENFDQGDVLVAHMTSPEYIFLMRKASAVVTDTGGLTSHAAIVTRELNIPCIVGTRFATRIFKNGDMVEVNVNTGTVRLVNKVES